MPKPWIPSVKLLYSQDETLNLPATKLGRRYLKLRKVRWQGDAACCLVRRVLQSPYDYDGMYGDGFTPADFKNLNIYFILPPWPW